MTMELLEIKIDEVNTVRIFHQVKWQGVIVDAKTARILQAAAKQKTAACIMDEVFKTCISAKLGRFSQTTCRSRWRSSHQYLMTD